MANKPQTTRHDVVLIRDSTAGQDEGPQRANVAHMLNKRGVCVPEQYWEQFVVSRSKVLTGQGFDKVMVEVTAGRVGTIYVESQDRFGGKNSKELFTVLNTLQKHGTKLIDLTEEMDLTSDDLINEIRTFLASQKSQEELRAIGRRSLRSRVNSFKEHGNWCNGNAPFGYGKALTRADNGRLRWEWHPTQSRSVGDRYNAHASGKLVLSETGVKVPPRDRRSRSERPDRIYLVPNRDPKIVRTVQKIFELYAIHGLSYRQIAIRLNKEGHTYYGKPFTFCNINEIIKNPAYSGTTVFGKKRTGEYYSFDAEGSILKINRDATEEQLAAVAQNITKEGTHKAIISKKLWALTVQRRARDAKNTAANNTILPARSPDYYLKGLLVCGHCGKYMTSRKEKKRAVYCCTEYSTAHSNGLAGACGYQTIDHRVAEAMILEKLKAMNIEFDKLMKGTPKDELRRRIEDIEYMEEDSREAELEIIKVGAAAVVDYFGAAYALSPGDLTAIKHASQQFLEWGGKLTKQQRESLPVSLAEFKQAFKAAEAAAVTKAERQVRKLKVEHAKLTVFQATTATPQQQEVLRPKIAELEGQIADWTSKCMPVRERLREIGGTYRALKEEQEELLKEWAGMDERVRGEALKRIIAKVVLYWDKVWHPAEAIPSRERTTQRPGRYSYHLDLSKTQWVFQGSDPYSTW
jgi:DNA invertase Pin-like site-specific DNA recombinase